MYGLTEGWQCPVATQRGAATMPADTAADACLVAGASVPGTVAAALRACGRVERPSPLELDHHDVWYRARFAGGGAEVLRFEGLATIADVWLNGEHLFRSENMFLPREMAVRTRASEHAVHLFSQPYRLAGGAAGSRALAYAHRGTASVALCANRPCSVTCRSGVLRCIRLGPGARCCAQRRAAYSPSCTSSTCLFRSAMARPACSALYAGRRRADGHRGGCEIGGHFGTTDADSDRTIRRRSRRPERDAMVAAHARHRHICYRAMCALAKRVRSWAHWLSAIAVDRGADGIGFASASMARRFSAAAPAGPRPDIVALPGDAASYRPWLEAARDAGMNMMRIGGTMLYEADDFYALCDELGLLVWQDAMFANFDYPTTDGFHAALAAELRAFPRPHADQCLPRRAVRWQ